MTLTASALVACGSMQLDAARDSWRGASYDEVLAAWGPPARNAGDSYTWLSEAQRSGGGAGGAIFSAEASCERTLVIRDARVVRAGDWNGAAESCSRFTRPRR